MRSSRLELMRSWSSTSFPPTPRAGGPEAEAEEAARMQAMDREECVRLVKDLADLLEDSAKDPMGRAWDWIMYYVVVRPLMIVAMFLACLMCIPFCCLFCLSRCCSTSMQRRFIDPCITCQCCPKRDPISLLESCTLCLLPRFGGRLRTLGALSTRAADLLDLEKEANVVVRLIPVNKLRTLDRWPSFNQAETWLEKITLNVIARTGEKNILYVAHKYPAGDGHPDPDGALLEQVKSRVTESTLYVWFDYTCVPPDAYLRMEQLRCIVYFPHLCNVSKFLLAPSDDVAFKNSVWCTLETLFDDASVSGLAYPARAWTMRNPDDLYDILPGFVHALGGNLVSRYYLLSEGEGSGKRALLSGIARFLIAHYEATKVPVEALELGIV